MRNTAMTFAGQVQTSREDNSKEKEMRKPQDARSYLLKNHANMADRQKIRKFINECDYLNTQTKITGREVQKHVKEFSGYLERFENFVGVALMKPQFTYDLPFAEDLENRYKTHGKSEHILKRFHKPGEMTTFKLFNKDPSMKSVKSFLVQ